MNIEQLIDGIASYLGFFSVLEVKDRYGYYDRTDFNRSEVPIFKTYYWNGWHGFLNAAMKRSRSAIICGDPAIRVHRVEYTDKYWSKVDRSAAASAARAKASSSSKSSIRRNQTGLEDGNAEATVCPPGIH